MTTKNSYQIVLIAIFVAVLSTGSSAQSLSSCLPDLTTLQPCLSYITGNESSPSNSCCSPLALVVKSEVQCLCLLVNANTTSFGNINRTRALDLPSICNIQTPSLSICNSTEAPSPSPSSSNAPSPTSSNTPSGGGTSTTPTPDTGSSFATKIPLALIFSLSFIALYY
ncbi:Bifunctional inhibitor/lipid-transfer protein/seed storage 2S albumin protein [Dioscorea alata]|uniref:Bifunctional inhibitor/lipid-transfer protein/seed storage 2S albumin protein n=1 Tax=Dioscorea alata TaxID=55571 RepID=A0ACB7UZS1_DIOAL|nr:Bifunctional inhibitor/lipid-transfer protein/seed storage 2S albumin protein [Dioscorea alata]